MPAVFGIVISNVVAPPLVDVLTDAPPQEVDASVETVVAGLVVMVTSNGAPRAALVSCEVIVNVFRTKVAVTSLSVVTLLIVHAAPLQSPLKLVNVDPVAADAVQVTVALYATGFGGLQLTVPLPLPATCVVTVEVIALKVAVMFLPDVTLLSVHVKPLVLLQPVKPPNVDPVAGDAVQLTSEPYGTGFGGVQLTVPVPFPAIVAVTLLQPAAGVVMLEGWVGSGPKGWPVKPDPVQAPIKVQVPVASGEQFTVTAMVRKRWFAANGFSGSWMLLTQTAFPLFAIVAV